MVDLDMLTIPFAAVIAGIIGAIISWIYSASRLPQSHRVAILGFPQTGKTTLITSIFDYMFTKGFGDLSIIPRGEKTIKKVNENISRIEKGKEIKPTKDQDVFAFRAEVVTKSMILSKRYKLEIGDFPGEDTAQFTDNYGSWLHETPYFKWAMSADTFLFVIDTGQVIKKDDEFLAEQKQAFRAAWQRLQENHTGGPEELSTKPLLLVFTKADMIYANILEEENINSAMNDPIQFGKMVNHLNDPRSEKFEENKNEIEDKFRGLIQYLSRENKMFDVVFTSAFLHFNEQPIGIHKVVKSILPGMEERLRQSLENLQQS